MQNKTNNLLISILNQYAKEFIAKDRMELLKILHEQGSSKLIEYLERDIKECSK